jgi:hypothetical protein
VGGRADDGYRTRLSGLPDSKGLMPMAYGREHDWEETSDAFDGPGRYRSWDNSWPDQSPLERYERDEQDHYDAPPGQQRVWRPEYPKGDGKARKGSSGNFWDSLAPRPTPDPGEL